MTRKTYSLIAGLIAAAGVGTWFWRTRQPMQANAGEETGRVIFDNTPVPSTPDGNLNL